MPSVHGLGSGVWCRGGAAEREKTREHGFLWAYAAAVRFVYLALCTPTHNKGTDTQPQAAKTAADDSGWQKQTHSGSVCVL